METLVSLSNISAGYQHAPVLHNLSMNIAQGVIYGLLGEANSGKSTLLRVISGQLPATKGELHWRNMPSSSTPNASALLETPRLYQHLSIREHVELFAQYYQMPQREVEQWLQLASLMPLADQRVKLCPSNSLKRLGLVIALIPKPQLLLIDDPEQDLNTAQQQRFFQLLRKINHRHNTTFLIASQNASLLENWSDQLGVLQNGELVWEGNPERVAPAVVVTARTRSSYLLEHLMREKGLLYERLDTERIRVQVRWKSDISMLAKDLVLNGVELLGIERQATPLSEVLALHAPSLRA